MKKGGHTRKSKQNRRKPPTQFDLDMGVNPLDLNSSEPREERKIPVQGRSVMDLYDDHLSPDEQLEARIKAGHAGIELIDWVQRTFECGEAKAITHVHRVINRSAEAIKKSFNSDQVLLMAFHLYRRSLDAGKIKDAAMILQNIMLSMDGAPTKDSGAISVKVLEYLPEKK